MAGNDIKADRTPDCIGLLLGDDSGTKKFRVRKKR